MIKCNKCGTQNKDGSRFCSNCGNDLNSNVNSNINNTNNKSSEKVLFCILAFFFPIIGIIVGCIYSKDKKEVSKPVLITSFVSIGVKVISDFCQDIVTKISKTKLSSIWRFFEFIRKFNIRY